MSERGISDTLRKLAVRPDEAAPMVGLSRNAFRALLRDGTIRTVRVGRAILVPIAAIEQWLAGPTSDTTASAGR